jgi:bifunctional non-homologous end joining protein LigD
VDRSSNVTARHASPTHRRTTVRRRSRSPARQLLNFDQADLPPMALQFPVEPMRAVLGTLPPDDGWAFEIKWDGYRTLAFVNGTRTRLQSSNRIDVTHKYPELSSLAEGVHATDAVLDAELVVNDDLGRPRFELIQQHKRQAAMYLFDVLSIDGHDVTGLPYEQRRQLLADLIEPSDNWTVPSHRIGDGQPLLDATAAQELEGVMAKRLGSTYQIGKRSKNWRKVKNRRRLDATVGGYTTGTGNRSTTFGSLLVGRWDADRLVFAGGVGTGFTTKTLEAITATLRELRTETCPFDPPPPRPVARTATWVEPVLIATLEIAEVTNDGLVRQSSFIGFSGSTGG